MPARLISLSIFIFIVLRMITIFFFIDSIYADDDTYRIFLAKEFIKKPHISILDYVSVRKGTLRELIAVIFLPVLAVTGFSYLGVKISMLVILTVTILLWIYFIKRYFGDKMASFFSIIFCFSPTPILNGGLILEHHFLILLFLIIGTIIWFKIFYEDRYSMMNFITLGIVCATGTWYLPTFFIFVIYIFIWWFIANKNFFISRYFAAFIISFFIFICPWIYYNMTHSFAGLYSDGGMIYQISSASLMLKRLYLILTGYLPHLFYFQGSNIIYKYFLYSIFILSYIGIVYIKRKELFLAIRLLFNFKMSDSGVEYKLILRDLFIVTFIPIVLFFLTASKVDLSASYFMFLYPFFLFVFSFFLQSVKYQKSLLSALSIMLICLTGRDFCERLAYYAPFQGLKYAGSANFTRLGRVLGGGEEGRKCKSFKELLKIIKYDDDARKTGILVGYLLEGNNWQESLEGIDRLDREYRFIFFHIFREKMYNLMQRTKQTINFEDFMHYLQYNSAKIREAISDYSENPLVDFNQYNNLGRMTSSLDSDRYYEQLIYESIGLYGGRYDNLKDILKRAESISEERISDICKGYGYYIGYNLCEESDILENLKGKKEKVNLIFCTIEQLLAVKLVNLPKRWKAYIFLGYMEGIKQTSIYEIEDSIYVTPLDITYYYNYINSSIDESYRPFVYYGIGVRFGRDIVYDDVNRILFFSDKINEKYSKYFYNGLGEGVSYVFNRHSDVLEAISSKISDRYKRFFLDGLLRNRHVFKEVEKN